MPSGAKAFRAARAIAAVASAAAFGACHEPLDTTRKVAAELTFGDDLYGVLCDRLGADVLREDLTGASYQAVCHPDADGDFALEIDSSVLPPAQGEKGKRAREIAAAKMNALAKRRRDLVRAFNVTFPDVEIDDPSTEAEGDTVNLLSAMMDLGQRVSTLYTTNPYDPSGIKPPLAPAATRGLGDLFAAVGSNDDAKGMLTRIWARQGYRPANVGLGVVKGAMAYPDLRDFTRNAVSLLGPSGAASVDLKRLLLVLQQEMRFMSTELSTLEPFTITASTAQPNRERTAIEFARELMLTEDDRFAPNPQDPPRYIAIRDTKGYAIPRGNGFVDVNGDGSADVDGFGRFIDASGNLLGLDTPFAIPGVASLGPLDAYGRPEGELYRYVDTSRTPAATVASIVGPLVDATEYAPADDPNNWKSEYETLMYALAALPVILGAREQAEYDFEQDQVVPVGTNCESCTEYTRFRGEDSPITHLVHALGQVLADKDSDAMLLSLIDMAENNEAELARVIAAALRVKAISDEHDALAASGALPPASLAYEVPVWDEAATAISAIAHQPRLMNDLLVGLADPVVISSNGASNHMGDTMALFASTIDELTYDQGDVNGPSRNLTLGSYGDPQTPVDWSAPRTGKNRSNLERTLQLMHDAAFARTCNRDGAVVKANLFGLSVDWPLVGDYNQCELFEINDLGSFFLGSVVDPTHPKRSEFVLKSDALNGIMDLLGGIQDPDAMFEQSSDLTGMTTHPTSNALMRLVFFGASSDAFPNMPDHDSINEGSRTDDFIYNLMDPAATSLCGDDVLCSSSDKTFRIRGRNSIFAWERRGFLSYMQPVLTAFVNVSCSDDTSFCDKNDLSGEKMFFDLTNVFWRHYPGEDHGSFCSTSVPKSDPTYCAGTGLNRYEPIIDKALRTDIVPALHAFAKASNNQAITVARGPDKGDVLKGPQVMEKLVRAFISQPYAASVGMTDWNGNKKAVWTDGTEQAQTTPFNMFADALHEMDVAFDNHPEGEFRKGQWRRARSQLVDVLMATEGTGANTRFKVRGMAPLLATTLRLVREQLNAHCPNRESGTECTWARRDLSKKVGDALSSPLMAAVVDLGEKLRADPKARRALERFIKHIVESQDGEALPGTLASMVDMMQILADDEKMVPIMKSASVALQPELGAADTALGVLKALSTDDIDKYHVMDHVLANIVTPVPGVDGELGLSPIETFIDVIAEVHRIDPSDPTAPLAPTDYGTIMKVLEDFMLSETRGLEQIYTIVRKRRKS